jgi:hypothetical protein
VAQRGAQESARAALAAERRSTGVPTRCGAAPRTGQCETMRRSHAMPGVATHPTRARLRVRAAAKGRCRSTMSLQGQLPDQLMMRRRVLPRDLRRRQQQPRSAPTHSTARGCGYCFCCPRCLLAPRARLRKTVESLWRLRGGLQVPAPEVRARIHRPVVLAEKAGAASPSRRATGRFQCDRDRSQVRTSLCCWHDDPAAQSPAEMQMPCCHADATKAKAARHGLRPPLPLPLLREPAGELVQTETGRPGPLPSPKKSQVPAQAVHLAATRLRARMIAPAAFRSGRTTPAAAPPVQLARTAPTRARSTTSAT